MAEKKQTKKMVKVDKKITNTTIVENLISKAITEKLPVETMEKFLAMRREVIAEQSKKAFDFAMSKFQGECPVIEKTKKVMDKTGGVRYSYASLDSIVGQVKNFLSSNQLSYSIKVENTEKTLIVKCIITHIDGHSEESSFEVPIGTEAYMSDVQKYGARLTFAKRYAFCNALGIMTGDGDNDANEEDKKPAPAKPPVKSPAVKPKTDKEIIVRLVKKLKPEIKDDEYPIFVKDRIKEDLLPDNFKSIISKLEVLVEEAEEIKKADALSK